MRINLEKGHVSLSKLKILLFGVCGGMVSMVVVSIPSLPGNFASKIIHGLISGSIISCGLVSGIVFSIRLIKQKSIMAKALIIIIYATIGGIIGHLIYAIIISLPVIALGVPMKGILDGVTSITSSGIIFSLGISCGLIFARIIARNKHYILRILIVGIGGLIGNIAVEFSYLLLYGRGNFLRIIFGLSMGLFIALAEKEEIII